MVAKNGEVMMIGTILGHRNAAGHHHQGGPYTFAPGPLSVDAAFLLPAWGGTT